MKTITVSEFYDSYYKQQAQNDNFTRISSIFGFKPTANKVINTMLKKNINAWQKVEVVSNITALETLYMGGSSNIDNVTVNICTNYVGASNLPLLDTKGDFGARLDKSAAASRYIFTRLHPNIDMVFNKIDLNVLPKYNFEDHDIEYKFLTFTVPMLLLNGSEGMGTGHAHKIFPRKLQDLKKYIIAHLECKKLPKLPVHYNGFTGKIYESEVKNQQIIEGVFKRNSTFNLTITDVPIGETYKSFIKKMDALVDKGTIKSYEDLCDPKTDQFNIIVKHNFEFSKLTDDGILDILKLRTTDVENFTVIDENNRIRVHNSVQDVMQHYIELKEVYLKARKLYIEDTIKFNIQRDSSKYEFIRRIQEDELIINKRSKSEIVLDLNKVDSIKKIEDSYDYLLNMSIQSLTKERMSSLKKSILDHKKELKIKQSTSTKEMWLEDLRKIK